MAEDTGQLPVTPTRHRPPDWSVCDCLLLPLCPSHRANGGQVEIDEDLHSRQVDANMGSAQMQPRADYCWPWTSTRPSAFSTLSSPIPPPTPISQLAVYGKESMRRMATANVLICGLTGAAAAAEGAVECSCCRVAAAASTHRHSCPMRARLSTPAHAPGLGVEVAKNVVLAGLKSITLWDKAEVAPRDLAAQVRGRSGRQAGAEQGTTAGAAATEGGRVGGATEQGAAAAAAAMAAAQAAGAASAAAAAQHASRRTRCSPPPRGPTPAHAPQFYLNEADVGKNRAEACRDPVQVSGWVAVGAHPTAGGSGPVLLAPQCELCSRRSGRQQVGPLPAALPTPTPHSPARPAARPRRS